MVEELRDSILLVSYGRWYTRLKGLYLGYPRVQEYKNIGNDVDWIKNEKMRTYIHIKMIKGSSMFKALNKVLSKEYLLDPDYRAIERD